MNRKTKIFEAALFVSMIAVVHTATLIKPSCNLSEQGSLLPTQHLVTASEYADFLNHVATYDLSFLYDKKMGTDLEAACVLCLRTHGKYSYQVVDGRENEPIVFVDEKDKAAYCKWKGDGTFKTEGDSDSSLKSNQSNFQAIYPFSLTLSLGTASTSTSNFTSCLEEVSSIAGIIGIAAFGHELMLRPWDDSDGTAVANNTQPEILPEDANRRTEVKSDEATENDDAIKANNEILYNIISLQSGDQPRLEWSESTLAQLKQILLAKLNSGENETIVPFSNKQGRIENTSKLRNDRLIARKEADNLKSIFDNDQTDREKEKQFRKAEEKWIQLAKEKLKVNNDQRVDELRKKDQGDIELTEYKQEKRKKDLIALSRWSSEYARWLIVNNIYLLKKKKNELNAPDNQYNINRENVAPIIQQLEGLNQQWANLADNHKIVKMRANLDQLQNQPVNKKVDDIKEVKDENISLSNNHETLHQKERSDLEEKWSSMHRLEKLPHYKNHINNKVSIDRLNQKKQADKAEEEWENSLEECSIVGIAWLKGMDKNFSEVKSYLKEADEAAIKYIRYYLGDRSIIDKKTNKSKVNYFEAVDNACKKAEEFFINGEIDKANEADEDAKNLLEDAIKNYKKDCITIALEEVRKTKLEIVDHSEIILKLKRKSNESEKNAEEAENNYKNAKDCYELISTQVLPNVDSLGSDVEKAISSGISELAKKEKQPLSDKVASFVGGAIGGTTGAVAGLFGGVGVGAIPAGIAGAKAGAAAAPFFVNSAKQVGKKVGATVKELVNQTVDIVKASTIYYGSEKEYNKKVAIADVDRIAHLAAYAEAERLISIQKMWIENAKLRIEAAARTSDGTKNLTDEERLLCDDLINQTARGSVTDSSYDMISSTSLGKDIANKMYQAISSMRQLVSKNPKARPETVARTIDGMEDSLCDDFIDPKVKDDETYSIDIQKTFLNIISTDEPKALQGEEKSDLPSEHHGELNSLKSIAKQKIELLNSQKPNLFSVQVADNHQENMLHVKEAEEACDQVVRKCQELINHYPATKITPWWEQDLQQALVAKGGIQMIALLSNAVRAQKTADDNKVRFFSMKKVTDRNFETIYQENMSYFSKAEEAGNQGVKKCQELIDSFPDDQSQFTLIQYKKIFQILFIDKIKYDALWHEALKKERFALAALPIFFSKEVTDPDFETTYQKNMSLFEKTEEAWSKVVEKLQGLIDYQETILKSQGDNYSFRYGLQRALAKIGRFKMHALWHTAGKEEKMAYAARSKFSSMKATDADFETTYEASMSHCNQAEEGWDSVIKKCQELIDGFPETGVAASCKVDIKSAQLCKARWAIAPLELEMQRSGKVNVDSIMKVTQGAINKLINENLPFDVAFKEVISEIVSFDLMEEKYIKKCEAVKEELPQSHQHSYWDENIQRVKQGKADRDKNLKAIFDLFALLEPNPIENNNSLNYFNFEASSRESINRAKNCEEFLKSCKAAIFNNKEVLNQVAIFLGVQSKIEVSHAINFSVNLMNFTACIQVAENLELISQKAYQEALKLTPDNPSFEDSWNKATIVVLDTKKAWNDLNHKYEEISNLFLEKVLEDDWKEINDQAHTEKNIGDLAQEHQREEDVFRAIRKTLSDKVLHDELAYKKAYYGMQPFWLEAKKLGSIAKLVEQKASTLAPEDTTFEPSWKEVIDAVENTAEAWKKVVKKYQGFGKSLPKSFHRVWSKNIKTVLDQEIYYNSHSFWISACKEAAIAESAVNKALLINAQHSDYAVKWEEAINAAFRSQMSYGEVIQKYEHIKTTLPEDLRPLWNQHLQLAHYRKAASTANLLWSRAKKADGIAEAACQKVLTLDFKYHNFDSFLDEAINKTNESIKEWDLSIESHPSLSSVLIKSEYSPWSIHFDRIKKQKDFANIELFWLKSQENHRSALTAFNEAKNNSFSNPNFNDEAFKKIDSITNFLNIPIQSYDHFMKLLPPEDKRFWKTKIRDRITQLEQMKSYWDAQHESLQEKKKSAEEQQQGCIIN